MTKREYELSAGDYRGSEGELEASLDHSARASLDFGLLPAVIFCFSKKKCEEIADHLKGQDLLTAKEKATVRFMIAQMSKRLNPLDAALPQVNRMEEMLSRGIAVHHGGLLPILKECVELLFSQSVVKVLIATETFAMGELRCASLHYHL
jgi:superfamily II RNA helicase